MAKYKSFFLSVLSLTLVFVLLEMSDLAFVDKKSYYYTFVSILLNVPVFIYMLLDISFKNQNTTSLNSFVRDRVANGKFITLNLAAYLGVIYFFRLDINIHLGIVLFTINNGITFLLFNLLRINNISKYKNEYILLICFFHIAVINLLTFDSQLVYDILQFIPILTVHFLDNNEFILLKISGYMAYLILLFVAYRVTEKEGFSILKK